MEHVVFFPSPDGTPAFRRLPSREEGLRFVEHLRNVEGVHEVSLAALTEVPLQFTAWYRAEVPAADAHVAAAPSERPAPVTVTAAEPAEEASVPAQAQAGERPVEPEAHLDAQPEAQASDDEATRAEPSLAFFAS